MGEINLDEKRQARLEAVGERSFVFKGERFVLPPELEWDATEKAIELAATDDPRLLTPTIEAIIGEKEWARFKALRPAIADINELLPELLKEYGLDALAGAASANGGGGDGDPGLDPKLPPSSSE
jgi:hypothetical protein